MTIKRQLIILYIKLNNFFICLIGVDWGTGKSYTLEIWYVYVKWANLEQDERSKRYLH